MDKDNIPVMSAEKKKKCLYIHGFKAVEDVEDAVLELQKARVRQGWSQGDLEAKSGVSELRIAAIENYSDGPSAVELAKLAVALGYKIILS